MEPAASRSGKNPPLSPEITIATLASDFSNRPQIFFGEKNMAPHPRCEDADRVEPGAAASRDESDGSEVANAVKHAECVD